MKYITKNKIYSILKIVLPILLWIGVWEIAALSVNNNYFLPDVPSVTKELFGIVVTQDFFKTVLYTALRVISGLALGIIIGLVMATLSYKIPLVEITLAPLVSIIKATPIASFIVLLWISMSGNSLVILVAFLMVFPIIWQNTRDGFNSIDKELKEVAEAYGLSFTKKLKILYFPTIMRYLAPAVITASGLAWKSEIAAEIIAYVNNSIGQHINDGKRDFESTTVFAWTIIVIVISICLELLAKKLLKKFNGEKG